MTPSEEQINELDKQLEGLQKTFIYDVNSKKGTARFYH